MTRQLVEDIAKYKRLDGVQETWRKIAASAFDGNKQPAGYRDRLAELALRAGADYRGSLGLLTRVKEENGSLSTKSGLMVGLGESDRELLDTMGDLRTHCVDILTFGQHLAPSRFHMPVRRYIEPGQFASWRDEGLKMGFCEVVAGPLVRSS